VRTNSRVERVRFDGRRAVGVTVEGPSGRRDIDARGEVILCAGALETPKLLMLSGIGLPSILRAHDIPVVQDLAVGNNLHDHPNAILFYRGDQPTDATWAQLYGFYRANPRADLPAGAADTCYVFYTARSSFREAAQRLAPAMLLPEQLYQNPALRRGVRALLAGALHTPPADWLVERLWGIVVILGKPESRGTVRLRSRNAADPPSVDPAYLSSPDDLETLVRGVRLVQGIAAAPPLRRWGNAAVSLRPRASRPAIERFIRNNLMTTYHFAGTCRMGTDPKAVVDPDLKVRGVDGLRVADAAVMPVSPVSALNAPSMMIGYRAADLVRAGAQS